MADALTFRLGLGFGLGSTLARLIALALALQVSFGLTRWLVFGSNARGPIAREWWRFMLANGFGGLCNFWLFVSLVAWSQPLVSGPWTALVISSSAAYLINYAGTRLFVYRRTHARPLSPGPAGPTIAPATPLEP
jgi:hypothetical protein